MPPIRCGSMRSTMATTPGRWPNRLGPKSISKVLYPSDATPAGQELRLRQEYFFVSASLQDLVRRHIKAFGHIGNLADKTAIQLNDTHPAIGVAEMMRILLDVHQIPWEEAWRDDAGRPSATPTTPCCRRRWRSGRCR